MYNILSSNGDDTNETTYEYPTNPKEFAIQMLYGWGINRPHHCTRCSSRAFIKYIQVKNIERTGDHAAFIAKDFLEFKKPIKKEILNKLQEMNDFSLTVLDESCLALFKEDYYQAEKTIKKIEEISKYEKKVRDSSKSLKDDEEIYRVRRLSENIRRISEYASDIAEIVLNMNIEKTLKKTE